jgi:hypothetical protein
MVLPVAFLSASLKLLLKALLKLLLTSNLNHTGKSLHNLLLISSRQSDIPLSQASPHPHTQINRLMATNRFLRR